jgi:cell division protein FtsL
VIARSAAWALLLMAVVGSGVGVVWLRQQSRVLFIESNQLARERDNLDFEFGRLQLEQATWAENNRIEQIARGRLGMQSLGAAETVVVRR